MNGFQKQNKTNKPRKESMHYRNGRAANDGDPVIGESWKGSGNIIAGKLHSTSPGSTSCNGQVAHPIVGGVANAHITVGDFYHAADAFAAVEGKQLTP